jgi:hypothetical protein
MVDSLKLTEDISLLTFLEAIDLDMLLTGMNQAPVDMPFLMRKFSSITSSVILVDAGPNKSQVANIIRTAMDLGLEDANKIIDDIPISLWECTDVDMATALRDKLNAEGAEAKVEYIYEEG